MAAESAAGPEDGRGAVAMLIEQGAALANGASGAKAQHTVIERDLRAME
jgi:hypothetical protein